MIKADNHTRDSAGPLPDDLRHALIKNRADVRTNLSQIGFHSVSMKPYPVFNLV